MASQRSELRELGRMMPGGMADPARAADALRQLIELVAPGHPSLATDRRPHRHDEDYAELRPVLETFLSGIFGCPRQEAWEQARQWAARTGPALRRLEQPEPVLRVIQGGKAGSTRP